MGEPEDLLAEAQRWRDAAADRAACNWRDIYLTLAEAYEQAARERDAETKPAN